MKMEARRQVLNLQRVNKDESKQPAVTPLHGEEMTFLSHNPHGELCDRNNQLKLYASKINVSRNTMNFEMMGRVK
jgi:hypothetical protein